MFFMSFLLRNKFRSEECGVDMSTPVSPMAPPLLEQCLDYGKASKTFVHEGTGPGTGSEHADCVTDISHFFNILGFYSRLYFNYVP